MMAKRGQVTFKGRENVRGKNCPRTFNNIENYEESLDTAL